MEKRRPCLSVKLFRLFINVIVIIAVMFFPYSIIVILCVLSFITIVIITVFNFLACAVCLWRINVFIIATISLHITELLILWTRTKGYGPCSFAVSGLEESATGTEIVVTVNATVQIQIQIHLFKEKSGQTGPSRKTLDACPTKENNTTTKHTGLSELHLHKYSNSNSADNF